MIAPAPTSHVSVCDRPFNTSATDTAIAFLGLGEVIGMVRFHWLGLGDCHNSNNSN